MQLQAFTARSRSGVHTFFITLTPVPPLKSLPAHKLCSFEDQVTSLPNPQTNGSLLSSFAESPLPPHASL